MAQKRSELLQKQPIIPNLSNVESKLKAMFISGNTNETQRKSEYLRKTSTKPPGKVRSILRLNQNYIYIYIYI